MRALVWRGISARFPVRRHLSPLRPHDLRHSFAYRLSAQTNHDASSPSSAVLIRISAGFVLLRRNPRAEYQTEK